MERTIRTLPMKPLALIPLLFLGLGGCEDARFQILQPPGSIVDQLLQVANPRLEVLWVIDNSASMKEEQQALADNFQSFFRYLNNAQADYHIGVISSDVYSPSQRGKLQGNIPILTPATPDAAASFAVNVQVGTLGKGDEQGIAAAEMALSEPLRSTTNAGFLRDDAYLFVIFVSDEDDHSFGDIGYHIRVFEQIKGIGNDRMVAIGSVVGDVPDGCPNARAGLRYRQLSQDTGGLAVSICDPSFASALDALGFRAAGLRRLFTLSEPAVPSSLHVWVKSTCRFPSLPDAVCASRMEDCGSREDDRYGRVCVVRASDVDGYVYEVETNSLRFYGQAVPPFGAVIEVGYFPAGAT